MPTPEGASRADQPLQVMFKIDSAPKQHNTVRHLRRLGRTSQRVYACLTVGKHCRLSPVWLFLVKSVQLTEFSQRAVGELVKQPTLLGGLHNYENQINN